MEEELHELKEPWVRVDYEGLEKQLERELSPRHPLYGVEAKAVARRTFDDDVLFELTGHSHKLAQVHLTWGGIQTPPWPGTEFYRTWAEWKEYSYLPAVKDFEDP